MLNKKQSLIMTIFLSQWNFSMNHNPNLNNNGYRRIINVDQLLIDHEHLIVDHEFLKAEQERLSLELSSSIETQSNHYEKQLMEQKSEYEKKLMEQKLEYEKKLFLSEENYKKLNAGMNALRQDKINLIDEKNSLVDKCEILQRELQQAQDDLQNFMNQRQPQDK